MEDDKERDDSNLACDAIASDLRKAIFSQRFKPGYEFRQEALAREFGTSRMPVRQALQMLAAEGFVLLRKNRSAIVNNVDFSDIADHFEIRGLLEGEAAAFAAIRAEDFSEIIEAEALIKEAKENSDMGQFEEANKKFHHAIWDAAKSPRLKALLGQSWNSILLGHTETPQRRIEISYMEHELVLNALLLRKPESARRAMYDHVVKHNISGLDPKKE
jgi:DNA-binding GntR family transcriptional regulator